MRNPTILIGLAVLALSACHKTVPPLPQNTVITADDPRDVDQCTRQTGLAWCKSACNADESRGWCDVQP